MAILIRNEGLIMNRKYALLFTLPIVKDWAFIAYVVLTLFSIFGGTDFLTAVISMYIFSLLWLVPRRILFKQKTNVSNTSATNQSGFEVSGISNPSKSNYKEVVTVAQIRPVAVENGVELRKGGYQDVVG